MSEVLPALPRDAQVSVFVVLHLPRDRPSLLAEVFSHKCALTVREAQDKEPVAPGTVYFAPSNYHLLIDEGPQLALSADELVHHSRPSIDVLFESAAEIYRERLLGVILTGGNEDGAAGLAAVHDAGGSHGNSGAAIGPVLAHGAVCAPAALSGSGAAVGRDRAALLESGSGRGTLA